MIYWINLSAERTEHYKTIWSNWLNLIILPASSAQIIEVEVSEECKNMPTYPDENSIKIINDVLVIKLSD